MAPRSLLLQSLLFILILKLSSAEICYSDVCEYTFVVRREQNLIWREPTTGLAFDVDFVDDDFQTVESPARPAFFFGPFIGLSVDPRSVITTDGVRRTVFTINGQFPGPTIEVTYGAQIVVKVVNALLDEGIGIHWHGMDQRGTVWMDGVGLLTQCLIPATSSFTYRFKAEPAGTYWYHSHEGAQINDGFRGAMIIHENTPTLPYSTVLVSDWFHYNGVELAATDAFIPDTAGSGGNVYTFSSARLVDGTLDTLIIWNSALINGRGRFNPADTWLPLTTFEVRSGQRHLFRVINGGGEYDMEVSIDSHTLQVVALDGLSVAPISVDAVVIPLGGRVDFEVVPDQPVDNYWLRGRTLKDLEVDPTLQQVLGIVRYDGAPDDAEPTTSYRTCTETSRCRVIGCPYLRYPVTYYTDCINVADAEHTYTAEERYNQGLDQVYPDVEYFLNARVSAGPFAVQFNSFNFLNPTAPVFQEDSEIVPCDDCPDDDVCFCTPVINVPFDKVVQIVVLNYQLGSDTSFVATHPIHFHGYHFSVLKRGFSDYKDYEPGDPVNAISSTPNPDLTCDDYLCRNARWTSGQQPDDLNLVNPPLMDTVHVPASGYFVMRFRSNNPGTWLFHCHIHHHSYQLAHMKILFKVGGEFYYPPLPPRMPTCASTFEVTDKEFERHMKLVEKALTKGGVFRRIPPTTEFTPAPPAPPPRHDRPRDDRVEKGGHDFTSGELIGLILGCIIIGIIVCVVAVVIVMCGCCGCKRRSYHEKQTHKVRFPVRIQPSYASYASPSQVFQVSPTIKY